MAYINLNAKAYQHNLNLLAQKSGGIEKIMAVLKDNAYGHGLIQMAPLATACGIKRAVVKNQEEALSICDFFEQTLVLIEPNPKNAKIDSKIAYSANDLDALCNFPNKTHIHLKLDSGMGRNGVRQEHLEEAFALIKKRELCLDGVFTHFYGADIIGGDFFSQKYQYEKMKEKCKNLANHHNLTMPVFHSKNSSALLRVDGVMKDDFARVGIAGYGYTDLDSSFGSFDLKPVMSLWANKISSRELEKGDIVGYCGIFRANKNMKVSTYDIGYGDGLFRYNGNGILQVENQKPLLGKMSMDSFSLEGSEDKVCVFTDVRNMAKYFDTITYEILTKLSPNLKRITKPLN